MGKKSKTKSKKKTGRNAIVASSSSSSSSSSTTSNDNNNNNPFAHILDARDDEDETPLSSSTDDHHQRRTPPPPPPPTTTTTKQPPPLSPPSGSTCWICLDDIGPLVRDCSCRGSGGYAHLACVIEYAEQKTKQQQQQQQLDHCVDVKAHEDPWRKCPNCRQHYRNEVAYTMATERVHYVTRTYPKDKPKHLEALFAKVPVVAAMGLATSTVANHNAANNTIGNDTTNNNKNNNAVVPIHPERTAECKRIAIQLLSLLWTIKSENSTIGTPWPKEEYGLVEGCAYNLLGKLAMMDSLDECSSSSIGSTSTGSASTGSTNSTKKRNLKMAMGYFGKYRDIVKDLGNPIVAKDAESNLHWAKSKYYYAGNNHDVNWDDDGDYVDVDAGPEEKLTNRRDMYAMCITHHGEGATCTIQAGLAFARELQSDHRTIEAERLLTKLASSSRRMHGRDHDITKRIQTDLHHAKRRSVDMEVQSGVWEVFDILRYGDGGGRCVVVPQQQQQVPIVDNSADQKDESVPTPIIVDTSDVHLRMGTPVTCHGLSSTERPSLSHLNGMIGDVRKIDVDEDGRCEVHFFQEDASSTDNNRMGRGWSLCCIKPENLEILFELPDE